MLLHAGNNIVKSKL